MRRYELYAEQWLPIQLNEAWSFFTKPRNLEILTPKFMQFEFLTKEDFNIVEGMILDYRVRPLLNIPLKWTSKIVNVKPLHEFTDIQIRGPFKYWEHTHTFVESDNGVLIKDKLSYELPFGILGDLAHSLFVKNRVDFIFSYRKKVLHNRFI